MNPRKQFQFLFIIVFTFLMAMYFLPAFAQQTIVTNPATGLTNVVETNATTIVQNLTPTPSVTAQSPAVALAMILIPLVVPLLVAVFKFFLPKIPSWVLPILATVLGAVLNWISTLLGGPGVGILTATLLGAAGVGVREILDQITPSKRANQTTGTGTGAALSLLMGLLLIPIIVGCAEKLANGGAYAPGVTSLTTNTTGLVSTNFTATAAPDYAFFEADASFDLTYSAVNAIFNFEEDNRNMLWQISPSIKHTLDDLRPTAVQIRNDYVHARIAYQANPIPANLSTLQDTLARIKATLAAVQAAIPPTIKIN